MQIPDYFRPYVDFIRKHPYLSGGVLFVAIMTAALIAAWVVVPGLGDRSKKAYAEAISSFNGDAHQEAPSPAPTLEPIPLNDMKDQIRQLGSRLADLEVSQINQDAALAEAEARLNGSISGLTDDMESLDERQAEWLATLKRLSTTTGISTSTASTSTAKSTPTPEAAKTSSGKVNVNTANLSELDGLPGIGETIAQRIIDYRAKNGPFASIDALKGVSGIGDSVFAKIQELITI